MSTLFGFIWLVGGVLCVVVAIKAGVPWITSFLAGVLLGPIGLALVLINQKKKAAADERERARRPTLDSSGPSLDSGPTLDAGPSVS